MNAPIVVTQRRAREGAHPLLLALVVCAALVAADTASPQRPERSGKEIVDGGCVACHGTGANGAPRIGDEKAWSTLASRGLTALTQSALDGIRKMPPHGGNPGLTDTEIRRAVTYMVNRSGGHWTEPVSRTQPVAARTGRQVVEARCATCHRTGVGGAPKIGDKAAWIPRLKPGFDGLVQSAIHGHGAMPPRGGMADLTDAEIRSAIAYMIGDPTAGKKP
jgi:cytochrome c5